MLAPMAIDLVSSLKFENSSCSNDALDGEHDAAILAVMALYGSP
jgi:hypothetical protein